MKRLSAVEADINKSHQHEFNGTVPLQKLLGREKLSNYPARFLWLGGENEGITDESTVTWYDARENHPTRTEYRLYFRDNPVMGMASENDLLIVAKRPDGELYFLVVPAGSTVEQQLLWLFDAPEHLGLTFQHRAFGGEHDVEVDFVVRFILEELGIEVQDSDVGFLDSHLEPYMQQGIFPTTKEFSELTRRIARGISAADDPDTALMEWMDLEERLFKRLERYLIAARIERGFTEGSEIDVDGFIKFSLSVHNRRKSRVGYALENHLEEVFKANRVRYSRTAVTENKSKPDFLFPGIGEYRNNTFPPNRLTMLGVKSTCKDRWRQVLAEAARIKEKHLLTLEPGISENQTNEMQTNSLQLVLPRRLHDTYKPSQQLWLMNVQEFVDLVKARQ
ncbi:MAG: restriction endonuclease [Alicyclobacillus sp.]|nr:restriction endonuclease [Alicyclobacillus sp.]